MSRAKILTKKEAKALLARTLQVIPFALLNNQHRAQGRIRSINKDTVRTVDMEYVFNAVNRYSAAFSVRVLEEVDDSKDIMPTKRCENYTTLMEFVETYNIDSVEVSEYGVEFS